MLIGFPHTPGSGGPGSFQSRFESALLEKGWRINHGAENGVALPDVVMVVGGTRKLAWLHRLRRQGVPIVYRLDGRLWLHRVSGFRSNPSHWLGSEVRNAMSQWIHGWLADCVVYQSEFARNWWLEQGWRAPAASSVIHNGIDLNEFSPDESNLEKNIFPDVVCVEGHVDYSPYSIDLLNLMAKYLSSVGARLILYGDFRTESNRNSLDKRVHYRGIIDRSAIASVYRNRIFLSLDVNPACPNAVVEALASGAPVIGFDTGAVKELVGEDAGEVIPFGSDPWLGNLPDFHLLPKAYDKIVYDQNRYKYHARVRAEQLFDLGNMVDAYVEVIHRAIERKKL